LRKVQVASPSTIHVAGGVQYDGEAPGAAGQVIRFLKSPAAVQVIKAKGMTPE